MRLTSVSKKFKSSFVKAAISVVVLVLIFYFVPISSVLDTLLVADPIWGVAGTVLLVLLRVLTSIRMQVIAKTQGLNTSSLMMMRIVFTSTFYNILAPGALAGGAVTYLKYRQQSVEPIAAMANIYANKSVQLLVVLLSAPLFWLIDKNFNPSLITGYALVMVIGFVLAFALFFGRFGTLRWLELKMNSHGQSVLHRALTELCRQVGKIGRISYMTIFYLVIFSAMHSLFAALGILCFGKALDIELGLTSILWIYSVVYLLGILPISISNIGVREAGMIMLMLPYGVSMTEATAWSVLMYSGTLSCALIGILMEAEHLWLRKKSVAVVDSTGHQLVEHKTKISQGKPHDDNSG
jgi:uncharacterized protein (TIRG00374 family)